MDATEFVRNYKRMVKERGFGLVLTSDNNTPEEIVAEAEKWAAEHPIKTRQSVFLEQYPETRIGDDGVLQIYPCSISASHRNARGNCATMGRECLDCRREFWMQEVE